MRSLEAHTSDVTGVGQSTRCCRRAPSLWLAEIHDPPLPSSTAVASVNWSAVNAAAVGEFPSRIGATPTPLYSTRPPVTSGGPVTPSGVAVGLGVGVAPALVGGVAEAVADAGASPVVLTTDPSGPNSSDPPVPFRPSAVEVSVGGLTGLTGLLGAVPNVMLIGAEAD